MKLFNDMYYDLSFERTIRCNLLDDFYKADYELRLGVWRHGNEVCNKYCNIQKYSGTIKSFCFYCMSAYLLLVGSILVIKLYWWFAFSVLNMRRWLYLFCLIKIMEKSFLIWDVILKRFFSKQSKHNRKFSIHRLAIQNWSVG